MITLDRNALRDCVKDAVREELQVFISKVGNMDDPPQKKQPTKLMTKKEMANELDISLVSLTEWMKQGVFPINVWESAFTSTKKMLWHP